MRVLRSLLVAVACLMPALAAAQAEHEVKAAFLVRFLSFVEWPESAFARPESPIVIGVVGSDEVLSVLQDITTGRVVQARPITVRRLKEGEPAAGVHLLFVGRAASASLPRFAGTPGVLVVGESEGGLERGATVNFVRRDARVRFEVALDAAERQGLRISSRMLSVAQYVRQGRI
jgi:hypothetical protein